MNYGVTLLLPIDGRLWSRRWSTDSVPEVGTHLSGLTDDGSLVTTSTVSFFGEPGQEMIVFVDRVAGPVQPGAAADSSPGPSWQLAVSHVGAPT